MAQRKNAQALILPQERMGAADTPQGSHLCGGQSNEKTSEVIRGVSPLCERF
jgi:hypothetical protein